MDTRKPAVKLSYKDQRELESLPKTIEKLESELDALQSEMSKPDFYQQDKTEIIKVQSALEKKKFSLEQAYARWEEIEAAL